MTTPRSARPGQAGQPGTSYQAQGTAYQAHGAAGQEGYGPDFARATWPAFMAAAIGGIAVGILLLAWPSATLTVVAVLIGVSLIVAGLLQLIHGFTAHDKTGGQRVVGVVIGLLAIIVGLYCIRHFHVTITVLAIVVGLFWVVYGIADIGAGLFGGPRASGRGLTVVVGVLSLIAGLIVLFWPAISAIVLVRVIGIWLLVYGVLMAIMALSLRRAGSSAAHRDSLTAA